MVCKMSYLRKEIHVFGLSSHIMSHKCLSEKTRLMPCTYTYASMYYTNTAKIILIPPKSFSVAFIAISQT